jgi:integrase
MPDLIRFALGSGLRVGEICAVRWMDLDLDGLRIVDPGEARRVPVVAVRRTSTRSSATASSSTTARAPWPYE